MTADRLAGNFLEPVDGTAGADSKSFGYTDANGDAVTAGGDIIRAGGGNDTINAEDGNDTIYGGAGDDVIDGWNSDDLVFGGDGNDLAHVSTGNDTLDMGAGQDRVRIWDNAGTKTLFGGSGCDRLEFANWQSSNGVSLTYNADGSGSFSHFGGATTGSFSQFEFVEGTGFADTINGGNATVSVEMDGKDDADTLSGGSGGDKIWGGAGQDSLVGTGGADQLYGGDANDRMQGDAGNDTLYRGREHRRRRHAGLFRAHEWHLCHLHWHWHWQRHGHRHDFQRNGGGLDRVRRRYDQCAGRCGRACD